MKRMKMMLGVFGVICIAAHGLHEPIKILIELPSIAEIIDNAAEFFGYVSEKITEAEPKAQPAPAEAEQEPQEPVKTVYRIRNAANEAASQLAAYYEYEDAKEACPVHFCVFDTDGNLLFTAE